MNGLALTYRGQGRFAEAAPLYARTLALQQRVLPPENADEMLISIKQLGLTISRTRPAGEIRTGASVQRKSSDDSASN